MKEPTDRKQSEREEDFPMFTIDEGFIIMIAFELLVLIVLLMFVSSKNNNVTLQNAQQLEYEKLTWRITYTKQTLDFLKELCQQTALLRFRDFIDNHEISKTTRSNYAAIVDVTARFIHDSLMRTNIKYDDLLVSQEYVNTYIIEVTSITIRDLLEKTIEGELDNH